MGWREIIRSEYKGYKVDVPDLPIKLSRNENPFDLPQELKEEVFKDLSEISWNRYPDGKSSKLRERLSSFLNIPSENIMVGLGSGDLIQIIANGILKPKDKVILPVPTFSLYEKIFEQKEAEILKIYLNKDNFSININ